MLDCIRLHIRNGVAQGNPAAIRAPDVATQIARDQIHFRRTVILKVDPADVCAISKAAQIAEAVLIYSKVIGGKILIINAVGRTAAAQVDPADIG